MRAVRASRAGRIRACSTRRTRSRSPPFSRGGCRSSASQRSLRMRSLGRTVHPRAISTTSSQRTPPHAAMPKRRSRSHENATRPSYAEGTRRHANAKAAAAATERTLSITIAILGLAVLILLHEAGHFFVARAVGMSPRRFYIGFPPALVKFKRKGIEYGIGAIPLGGYVKIPGMHRPAPADLDAYFVPELAEAPQLLAPLERVKRRLAGGDMEGARGLVEDLERALAEAEIGEQALRASQRG